MIYELRTYWTAPGKIGDLHNRFRNLTLSLFKRHGIDVVGFWTPANPSAETGDLVYLVRFENESAMQKAWEAFRSDPDWIKGKADSEVDGRLAVKVVSQVLHPTDYSTLT